jgi:hypothetical protein
MYGEYNDTKVSAPLSSVALTSSLTPGRDVLQFSVVDSASSINLIAFRDEIVSFESSSGSSRVGGVGIDVMGSGTVYIVNVKIEGAIRKKCVHSVSVIACNLTFSKCLALTCHRTRTHFVVSTRHRVL